MTLKNCARICDSDCSGADIVRRRGKGRDGEGRGREWAERPEG